MYRNTKAVSHRGRFEGFRRGARHGRGCKGARTARRIFGCNGGRARCPHRAARVMSGCNSGAHNGARGGSAGGRWGARHGEGARDAKPRTAAVSLRGQWRGGASREGGERPRAVAAKHRALPQRDTGVERATGVASGYTGNTGVESANGARRRGARRRGGPQRGAGARGGVLSKWIVFCYSRIVPDACRRRLKGQTGRSMEEREEYERSGFHYNGF